MGTRALRVVEQRSRSKAEGLYPVGVVAWLLDCSTRNVQLLAREGRIPKASRGRYDLVACVHGYIRHLRKVAAGYQSSGGHDLIAERARLTKEQADEKAMKNAQLRGELIPAADNEATLIGLATHVRQRLLGVPSKAAPLVHGAQTIAEVKVILEEHIHEALHALADAADEVERLRRERVAELGENDDGSAQAD